MWFQIRVGLWACALAALACSASGADEARVTCGSVVKLQHLGTGADLHSHEVAYGSGSGQQSVTAMADPEDANSFWSVRAPLGEECPQGTALKSGARVRLQHVNTRTWLHSHHFPSPLTQNQEVSAFGGEGESDHLDVWEVTWDKGGGTQWLRDKKVKLKHVETGVYLASSERKYGRPISGQQEVCGRKKADWWAATEGVYFTERPADA